MNTLDVYTTKNTNKRKTMKTTLLTTVLLLAGASGFAATPAYVHGATQTLSACQNSAAIDISSMLAITDPDNGETATWTIITPPANGIVTPGTTEVVAGGGAVPTGFNYTPTGMYTGTDVIVVQVSDGTNTTNTTINVTVNANPALQTFTGGGGYCMGGAGAPIGLTLTESGVSYQLYQSPATAVGSPATGSGPAVSFGTFTAGYYYAIATKGACSITMPGVTVSANPLPTVFNMTGTDGYCPGSAGVVVGLDGSDAGVEYQLYDGVTPVGAPVAGTGAAINFGSQLAGNYTAVATNTTTHCTSNMDGAAVVTILPLPQVFNVTGGGYYCLGGSPVAVSLDGSETDVNYQLVYLGIIPIGGTVAGSGTTLDMGDHFLPGDYTVFATSTVTGCSVEMNDNAQVNFSLPPARYTVTQDRGGNYCVGDTGVHVGLSNSSVDVSYQLYQNGTAVGTAKMGTGAALDYGLFTTEGVYKVIATDVVSGCVRTMRDSSVVKSNPNVVPTVKVSSGIADGASVCAGTLATLTAMTNYGGDAAFYEWKVNNISVGTGDSTYTYVPVNGEIVSVILHSNYMCAKPETATHMITINVDTLLAPSVFLDVNPLTSVPAGTTVTLTAIPTHGGPAPEYQWYKNGVLIAGATSATYSSSSFVNGDSVSCRMTSSGGCGGVVTFNSAKITVYPVGISQTAQATEVKLVPNPNKGIFTVKGALSTAATQEVSVEVTNILGQVVYRSKTTAVGGVVNETVQLNAPASGMYILTVKAGTEQTVARFVVE